MTQHTGRLFTVAIVAGSARFDTPADRQPKLEVGANWQTQARGSNDAEYQIYRTNAEQPGRKVKAYDEWLNS